MREKVFACFEATFGYQGRLYAAPGRINLIGEHTDYNMGWVLPGAIDKQFYVAIAANGSRECRVCTAQDGHIEKFDMQSDCPPEAHWLRYIYGEARELMGEQARGFDLVVGSDIPVGAGISSSAAFTSSLGLALNDVFELGYSRMQLAKAGQLCEHHYAGVSCGIMDPFASLFGKKGYVMQLDCRSLEYVYRPFAPQGLGLVLLDTRVKHSLAAGAYNERRRDCETGVACLQKVYPQIQSLRDVSLEQLDAEEGLLNPRIYRRCRYVIEENARVVAACAALDRGDYAHLGSLMLASHEGLSKAYEVSCVELDFLQELAAAWPGVLGSRMMGGGFGGCTLNLLQEDAVDGFVAAAHTAYEKKFWRTMGLIRVGIGEGASIV